MTQSEGHPSIGVGHCHGARSHRCVRVTRVTWIAWKDSVCRANSHKFHTCKTAVKSIARGSIHQPRARTRAEVDALLIHEGRPWSPTDLKGRPRKRVSHGMGGTRQIELFATRSWSVGKVERRLQPRVGRMARRDARVVEHQPELGQLHVHGENTQVVTVLGGRALRRNLRGRKPKTRMRRSHSKSSAHRRVGKCPAPIVGRSETEARDKCRSRGIIHQEELAGGVERGDMPQIAQPPSSDPRA